MVRTRMHDEPIDASWVLPALAIGGRLVAGAARRLPGARHPAGAPRRPAGLAEPRAAARAPRVHARAAGPPRRAPPGRELGGPRGDRLRPRRAARGGERHAALGALAAAVIVFGD